MLSLTQNGLETASVEKKEESLHSSVTAFDAIKESEMPSEEDATTDNHSYSRGQLAKILGIVNKQVERLQLQSEMLNQIKLEQQRGSKCNAIKCGIGNADTSVNMTPDKCAGCAECRGKYFTL